MNEQRKESRKKIMSFTPVFDSKTFDPIGYIGDLTMLGALIIGEKPLEVGTKTTFVIDFPETPDFPARRVKIAARVVWDKHYPDKQYYGSGIEFHKISDENKTVLESILARYQYRRISN